MERKTKLEEKAKDAARAEPRTAWEIKGNIQPNKWYGTCYGRELEADYGINFK